MSSMIRVDFKRDGNGHVATTWIKEDGDSHSMMGRLLFDEKDFNSVRLDLEDISSDVYFEEKK